MAKFPLSCKDRKAQNMITGFSELEINVAWLLSQMSSSISSRDNKLIMKVKNNEKLDEAEKGTSCQSDAKSNDPALYTIFKEEEEIIFGDEDHDADGYPNRRNKRFRSIDHIYKVTQPVLLDGFACCNQKMKLSCT